MKKYIIGIISIIAVLIGAIIFFASVYTVKSKESAIIVRLGKAQDIINETGLHTHTPFIESTVKIYMGDILYDMPKSDVITSDKKSMIADNYVIWKVTDPLKYYQTLGGVKGRAEERVEAAVYNATKNTISSMTQDEIIAARGMTLTNAITKASNSDIAQYGIAIELAEIKALDLPNNNKASVYNRMISERQNIAASYTAQGNREAQIVINDTDKQAKVVIANAEAKAEILKAEGESEYMKILSAAYNDENKAAFYNYLRGLDSLEALAKANSTIILDKNSEYAKMLYGIKK